MSIINLSQPYGIYTNPTLFSWFNDDMLGSLAGSWLTRVSTGSRVPLSKDNGWYRLETGASLNDEESIDFNNILLYTNTKRPIYKARIQLQSIADVAAEVGLIGLASNDYIRFKYDSSGSPNWVSEVSNAGSATAIDTGVPASTDEIELGFDFQSDIDISFYVDGANTSGAGVNVPTNSLQPYFLISTLTTAIKALDIDFVNIVQERV